MKKCSECAGEMREVVSKTPEGIGYNYFKCMKCGEEVLNMSQLHSVAEKYRVIKNYHVKLTKWGLSLGMRIPKEIVKKYKLKDNAEVVIIPDESGIKVVTTG